MSASEKNKISPESLLGVPLKFETRDNPSRAWLLGQLNAMQLVSGPKQMFHVNHVSLPTHAGNFDDGTVNDERNVAFRVKGVTNMTRRVQDGGRKENIDFLRVEGYGTTVSLPHGTGNETSSMLRGKRVFLEMSVKRPGSTALDRIMFLEKGDQLWPGGNVLFDEEFKTVVRGILHLTATNPKVIKHAIERSLYKDHVFRAVCMCVDKTIAKRYMEQTLVIGIWGPYALNSQLKEDVCYIASPDVVKAIFENAGSTLPIERLPSA